MDIENLIFSIFDFTFSILIVLGEIFIFAIILLIYGVIIYKKFHKKQNIQKDIIKFTIIIFFSIIIIFLTGFIFYIKEPSLAKLVIDKKLNNSEVIGKWNLTYIVKKMDKDDNYIELDENGLCKFNSIDYNSSKYINSNCQWTLEHNIKADNSLYKNNVITIILDISLEKRYFYFKQQGNELILYNYYLNDWYDKIEYRREE